MVACGDNEDNGSGEDCKDVKIFLVFVTTGYLSRDFLLPKFHSNEKCSLHHSTNGSYSVLEY